MRILPVFPAVAAAALMTAAGLSSQSGGDVCPLAVRPSSARPGSACLDRRTLPRPVSPVVEPRGRVGWLPLDLGVTYRSGYPVDRANGAPWSGRGLGSSLRGGVVARVGALTVALEPVLWWSENADVVRPDTLDPGLSAFAYPWASRQLDWYLRPGAGALRRAAWGESWAELAGGGAAVGVSTERLRWGPARRYPLLFGGNGEGFPHAYAATDGGLATPLGTVRGAVLLGRTEESDWFDVDPRNDHRLLGAGRLQVDVAFVPGLSLGVALAHHQPYVGRPGSELEQLLAGDPEGEDPALRGLAAGTFQARLADPEGAFEAYVEIGRGKAFSVGVPGISDTDLGSIYLLGFTRTLGPASGVRWRVAGEAMRQGLDLPQPPSSRREPAPDVPSRAGHTHRGALLGAWVGPGSNAQYLAVERLTPARSVGVFAERARRDDDTYYRVHARNYGFRGHDVEWTLGVRAGGWLSAGSLDRLLGPVGVGIEAGLSRRKNRNFIDLDQGRNWVFRREWNGWADLWLRWDPRLEG